MSRPSRTTRVNVSNLMRKDWRSTTGCRAPEECMESLGSMHPQADEAESCPVHRVDVIRLMWAAVLNAFLQLPISRGFYADEPLTLDLMIAKMETIGLQSLPRPPIWLSVLYFGLLYLVGRILYRTVFHPLCRYPSPTLWAATRLPWVYYNYHGRLIYRVKELHDRYGPVVRIAPDELSFIEPEAWKAIYGGTDVTQLDRDPYLYPPENTRNLPNGIIHAGHADHARIRKRLAYAFSSKALEEEEALISSHVDLLIKQLSRAQGPLNISDWLNFVSFDTVADLALGQSLGCLESGEYHPLAKHLIGAFRAGILMSCLNRYVDLAQIKFLLRRIIPKTLAQNKAFLVNLDKTVRERMGRDSDRPDFISYMLNDGGADAAMTVKDIRANMAVFFIGGSESSASLLSGLLYYLHRDPTRLAKATAEVRSAFTTEDKIDYRNASKLPYLTACLEEGLRVSTPTPFGVARRTTNPMMIGNHEVPADTSVSVYQWAAFHSEENFSKPYEFLPERWMPEHDRFATDRRGAFHPFGMGPRGCMGKHLAYVEMRLIITRLLWDFDMKLEDDSFAWENQKAFLSWSKLPLMMSFSKVER